MWWVLYVFFGTIMAGVLFWGLRALLLDVPEELSEFLTETVYCQCEQCRKERKKK